MELGTISRWFFKKAILRQLIKTKRANKSIGDLLIRRKTRCLVMVSTSMDCDLDIKTRLDMAMPVVDTRAGTFEKKSTSGR